jgi:hypothetical protein
LRAAALARREQATSARLIRAQATTASPRQRRENLARADAHQQLADSLALRDAALSEIDTQRARWYDATAQARADAREATDELSCRFPGADLSPFHDQPRERARTAEHGQPHSRGRAASPASSEYASAELRRAAEPADQARHTLDTRSTKRGAKPDVTGSARPTSRRPPGGPTAIPDTTTTRCAVVRPGAPPRAWPPRTSPSPSPTSAGRAAGWNPAVTNPAGIPARPNATDRKPRSDSAHIWPPRPIAYAISAAL